MRSTWSSCPGVDALAEHCPALTELVSKTQRPSIVPLIGSGPARFRQTVDDDIAVNPQWCPGRDSNPQAPVGAKGFKTARISPGQAKFSGACCVIWTFRERVVQRVLTRIAYFWRVR